MAYTQQPYRYKDMDLVIARRYDVLRGCYVGDVIAVGYIWVDDPRIHPPEPHRTPNTSMVSILMYFDTEYNQLDYPAPDFTWPREFLNVNIEPVRKPTAEMLQAAIRSLPHTSARGQLKRYTQLPTEVIERIVSFI